MDYVQWWLYQDNKLLEWQNYELENGSRIKASKIKRAREKMQAKIMKSIRRVF